MTAPAPIEPRKLALGTLAAVLVAAVVLVVAVLPAEYGVDPTGLGRALGFAALGDEADAPVVEADPDGSATVFDLAARWRVVAVPIAERSGYVDRDDTEARVTIPIAIANLTSITATLRWNDDDLIDDERTEGDALEVGIRGPNNFRSPLALATNEPGAPGVATTSVGVASVPLPDERAKGGLLLPNDEDTRGIGNWTFVVRLYHAGGRNGSDALDPGQTWTLTVTGEAYELAVQKQTDRLGDRVLLQLAPGRQVEYKFEMQANATMQYRWNATAPVYVDMHGDRFEDPETFVSAKTGTLQDDRGTYVARFHGRHGWYFRNDGATSVTITLETAGNYRILGAV